MRDGDRSQSGLKTREMSSCGIAYTRFHQASRISLNIHSFDAAQCFDEYCKCSYCAFASHIRTSVTRSRISAESRYRLIVCRLIVSIIRSILRYAHHASFSIESSFASIDRDPCKQMLIGSLLFKSVKNRSLLRLNFKIRDIFVLRTFVHIMLVTRSLHFFHSCNTTQDKIEERDLK